jgi:two-component system, LytTR family, response regulator
MSQEVIRVLSKAGPQAIPLDNIEMIEAAGAYSTIHLKNKTQFVVSKTLKRLTNEMTSNLFIRPNHSCLVNLSCISSKDTSLMSSTIVLRCGKEISISRRKRAIVTSMIS